MIYPLVNTIQLLYNWGLFRTDKEMYPNVKRTCLVYRACRATERAVRACVQDLFNFSHFFAHWCFRPLCLLPLLQSWMFKDTKEQKWLKKLFWFYKCWSFLKEVLNCGIVICPNYLIFFFFKLSRLVYSDAYKWLQRLKYLLNLAALKSKQALAKLHNSGSHLSLHWRTG